MTLLGQEIIKATSKTLPNQPGVYQMQDDKGNILYIGKAKVLSNRVKNYLSLNNLTRRIQRMVSLTKSMNFFVTNTELEAIILECNLIKKHKPRFNVLLRDDKSFPYIFISSEHDFPRIEKHRGPQTKKGRYYGPFASPDAVNRTINTIQRIFLLRSCTDKEVNAGNKLCFNYYLKRCSGPCGGKITKEAYSKLIEAADDFLSSGNSQKIQKNFTDQMYKASKKNNFELAASLRDRLKALKHIEQNNSIKIKDIKNADIFAITSNEGKTCIYGSFFRNNTSYGGKAFYPDHDNLLDHEEIMLGFLNIFYAEKDIPETIITNITIDFALVRLTNILDNMIVYPKKMLENLNITKGLIFSQELMLELTKTGLTREKSYRMVQSFSKKCFAENLNLFDVVRSDRYIMSKISIKKLKSIFSYSKHMKNVNFIFRRVIK